ncbi:PREDICTED: protein EMBRYONIC FLOWER 1-like [Nelumbo nucifera]|uniref:Protein EMBRYONIC FLOWER 1-like n=2 Tax=Nelumbo nucifera TaxID=4432 RepID=A0A1U7ZE88_NELNU|nr:PREDICTED: protein EMBRYONIC FLOWER 1-like [Nelumbo nucifera]DAD35559.1 TPA_asm: hypothetical protein HUJ06_006199 [Nelumbo nucifera]
MDESIMGACNSGRSEPTLVANSTISLTELRSSEHVTENDKQDGGRCTHFSIRGYVAEVRRKDRKICWPFPTVGDQTEMLPPLQVPEFRWWRCQKCLQKYDAKNAPTENGMLTSFCNTETGVGPCCTGEKITREGKLTITFKIDKHENNLSSTETATAHEKNDSEAATLKSKSDEFHEPGYKRNQVINVGFDVRNCKYTSKDSKEICNKGMPELCSINLTKMNKQYGDTIRDCGTSKVVDLDSKKNEAPNSAIGQTEKLNPLELGESDYEYSENDENLPGNTGGRGGILQRCKTRKVRLLTDIIRSEVLATSNKICSSKRNARIDDNKAEGLQYKATTDASSEAALLPGIKNQAAFQRNDIKDVLGKKKKRKMPSDEDMDPSRMIWPKATRQNVRIFQGNAEIKHIDTAFGNSEMVSDASIRMDSYPDSKVYLPKYRNDKNIMLDKKKNKMPKGKQRQPSLAPWDVNVQREFQIMRDLGFKCGGTETFSPKSAEDAFSERDVMAGESGLQNYVAPQNNGGKHISNKNKNKMSPIDGISRNDATVPFKSSQGVLATRGGHCSINSDIAIHKKAIVSKKHDNAPFLEDGGPFKTCQSRETSNTCNYENATEVQRLPNLPMSECDQKADKMNEQTTLDDIPMEIVELMARNQYERRLFYAKDAAEAPEHVALTLLCNKSFLMQSQSSNAGSDTYSRSVEPTKSDGYSPHVNRYNTIHLDIRQPENACASMRFTAFAECQEKLSSGYQYPLIGSGRNCHTQNCNWSQNILGKRCLGSCFQPIKAHGMSQSYFPQYSCKEQHHAWSSVTPNNTSFGINSPQEFLTESSNLNMVSQYVGSLSKGNLNRNHGLNLIDQNATHLQRQKGGSDTGIRKRSHLACTEKGNEYHSKMIRPLDLYTNETISAMHLLRLMDSGACSNTTVNIDGNLEKFPERPFIPHDHLDKELSRVEVGISKRNEASIHEPSYDYFNKSNYSDKFCEHFCPAYMVDKYRDSRTPESTDGIVTKTPSHSFKVKDKKGKSPFSPAETRSLRSQRCSSRDDISRKIHGCVPASDLSKGFLSSDSMQFHVHSQVVEGSTRHVELEVNKNDKPISPVETIFQIGICTINRNPADFTVPEAGNIYMIEGRNLPCRKIASGDRANLITLNGQKRQRMVKLKAMPDHVHR